MKQEIVQEKKSEQTSQSYKDGMVHLVLSHSYTVFMIAVVVGVILDVFVPVNLFSGPLQYAGIIMILCGSGLIYWSQSSSNSIKPKTEAEATVRDFENGPYKYSRNPTHIGLSIMTFGLAFVLNSLSSVILVIIASYITKRIFLRKEEHLLEETYGKPYFEYKKKVKSWL